MHAATSLPLEASHRNGVVISAEPISDDITAQLMVITPQMAAELLANRPTNRPISKARVRSMIADMRAGRWVINAESIILDAELRLLDGQHRLQAVLESGIAITALVAVGVSPEAMPSIDQGRSKSGADVLHMAQLPHAQQLASSARWLWRYQNQAMRQAAVRLPNHELPAFIAAHPGLQGALPWGRKVRMLAPEGACSMLYSVMARKDAGLAERFYTGLATGQELTADDPSYVVRERLIKDRSPLHHLLIVARLALLVLGWNCTRRGKACQPSATWRGLSDKSIAFPEVV